MGNAEDNPGKKIIYPRGFSEESDAVRELHARKVAKAMLKGAAIARGEKTGKSFTEDSRKIDKIRKFLRSL